MLKRIETNLSKLEAKGLTKARYPVVVFLIVEVTAIIDSITINDIIVNNSNCSMRESSEKSFPDKLKYGEKQHLDTIQVVRYCFGI